MLAPVGRCSGSDFAGHPQDTRVERRTWEPRRRRGGRSRATAVRNTRVTCRSRTIGADDRQREFSHRDGTPHMKITAPTSSPLPVISVGGARLDHRQIAAARSGVQVVITAEGSERVRQSWLHGLAVADDRPLYGRTTGVGANRTVRPVGDPTGLARSLLRSHAPPSVSLGPQSGCGRCCSSV